jgi:valyl-tRNA synthetase
VPVASVLDALVDGARPPEFVGPLARFRIADAIAGAAVEPVATIGPVRILPSEELSADAVAARLERRRDELRAEVERAERKLGNEGFVAKAPPEVVEEERGKLERYRSELAELG